MRVYRGPECAPQDAGFDPGGIAHVLDLVQRPGARAQVCVRRGGKVVLDRALGCGPDALFLLFSAGKPFVAVLTHVLAQQGVLDLDDPVCTYWPAFAAAGKDGVTIRQVLQHRAGLPVARSLVADAMSATSWRRSTRALERAAPRWPPGTVPAYHILSYGFILGEVARRATGQDLPSALRTHLLEPLGLHDTYPGLPDREWFRHVAVTGAGPARLRAAVFNRRRVRAAVIPAATVSSTARDLARFYQALADARGPDGGGFLHPATVRAATCPSSDGETDRFLHLPIRWSQGFQLGGPAGRPEDAPGRHRPLGRRSDPEAFGHNGSNCCLGWADPRRRIVVAYLTDRLESRLDGSAHFEQVSDAVLAADVLP